MPKSGRWSGTRLILALACLVVGLVTFVAPAPARAAALPRLLLEPNRGPCPTSGATIDVRGVDFPPGETIILTVRPGRSDGLYATIAGVVAPDGTFSAPLRLLGCGPDTPEGFEFHIFASPDRGRGGGGPLLPRTVYLVATSATGPLCFTATEQCIAEGPFLDRWLTNGALAINGYPLGGAFRQTLEDGKEYTVQYFERARLELHPENAAPYDVLLGQFGRRILATVPGAPTAPLTPIPDATSPDTTTYFPETGHTVRDDFLFFWRFNGGVAQFGYPLSAPFTEQLEDGQTYTVQYFERARFELHPSDNVLGGPYEVLLGQFGRRILAEGLQPAVVQSPASGYCPEAQGAEATVRVNSDTPSPRCQKVRPGQHLRIINATDRSVRARLAQIDVTIPPGGEWADDRPFGTYLAPGVHSLALSAYAGGGAELWVQP